MDRVNYWTARARLSRRGFVRTFGGAGAGVGVMALVGCGDDDTTSGAPTPKAVGEASVAAGVASPATVEPKRGGTNVMAQTTSLTDINDPHTSLSQAGRVWSYIGNTPLRSTRDLKSIDRELVEKWEIPSDGTEIVLTTRQGVTWHNKPPANGRAFVADDLAFSLARITGRLNPATRAAFQRASTLPNFDSATAVDEKTVRVKLTAPHSSFVNGLSDWRNTVVSRDFVEKGGKFEDSATLIGTGPFVIDSWENSQKVTFKANPNFWEKGKPYIDGVQWVWYGDRLSAIAAFSQGKLDYFDSPTPAEAASLKKLGSDFREESFRGGNWSHFRFNATRSPFNDARVRRAIHLALDYKSMNDGFYGTEPGAWLYTGALINVFPEAFTPEEVSKMPGYNPTTKDADIKAAKDLMTAAGYATGAISFKIMPSANNGSTYENVIRAIDQLNAIWPAMKIEVDVPADNAIFARRQVSNDFDMHAYGISAGMDAAIELSTNVGTTGSRNYGKFSDTRVDQLLEKATTQLDSKARGETLKEAQRLLLDALHPCIYISTTKWRTYFRTRVKGMVDYITPLGGSSIYDTSFHTKEMWFDPA